MCILYFCIINTRNMAEYPTKCACHFRAKIFSQVMHLTEFQGRIIRFKQRKIKLIVIFRFPWQPLIITYDHNPYLLNPFFCSRCFRLSTPLVSPLWCETGCCFHFPTSHREHLLPWQCGAFLVFSSAPPPASGYLHCILKHGFTYVFRRTHFLLVLNLYL